jgi:hypothetical protein
VKQPVEIAEPSLPPSLSVSLAFPFPVWRLRGREMIDRRGSKMDLKKDGIYF